MGMVMVRDRSLGPDDVDALTSEQAALLTFRRALADEGITVRRLRADGQEIHLEYAVDESRTAHGDPGAVGKIAAAVVGAVRESEAWQTAALEATAHVPGGETYGWAVPSDLVDACVAGEVGGEALVHRLIEANDALNADDVAEAGH